MAAARCTASLRPCTPAVSAFVAGGRGSLVNSSGAAALRQRTGAHFNGSGSARRRAPTMLFSGLKKALGGQASPSACPVCKESCQCTPKKCSSLALNRSLLPSLGDTRGTCLSYPNAGSRAGLCAGRASCALCRHGALVGRAAGKPEISAVWRAFATCAASLAAGAPWQPPEGLVCTRVCRSSSVSHLCAGDGGGQAERTGRCAAAAGDGTCQQTSHAHLLLLRRRQWQRLSPMSPNVVWGPPWLEW